MLPRQVARPLLSALSVRQFAADAKSETFLPVSEVAERVLNVVKNFEKVDPAKVGAIQVIALALRLILSHV
jgi:NADH dehydrogenase (ubiquinone) 1 alpha/beta subcomplex 1